MEQILSMKKKFILTVTLNPAVDKTVTVTNFTLGQKHLQEQQVFSAGGKGLNVARVLKSYRTPTVSTGFLGGVTGDRMKILLKRERLMHDFVDIKNATRVNLTVTDLLKGKETRILEKGPRIFKKEIKSLKKKYCFWLSQCAGVVLSGRNAYQAPRTLYAELIHLAHVYNVPVFLDTHSAPLKEALPAAPTLIAPNRNEAEEAFGYALKSKSDYKQAFRAWHSLGIKYILISRGKEGLIGSYSGQDYWAKVPNLKHIINEVGCGDSLLGAFVYYYLKGMEFKQSLAFAAATGSANCYSLTPGLIDREKVASILKKISINKL